MASTNACSVTLNLESLDAICSLRGIGNVKKNSKRKDTQEEDYAIFF